MRDKVKRFISILMTALMLVNLLPVGALAEGVKISNSVQSRAQKRPANVYVYVKVTGDTTGLTQNSSGWFTLGIASNVDGMGDPTYKTPRRYSYDEVGVEAGDVIKNLNHQYNTSIVLRNVNWNQSAGDEAGFVIANGANGNGSETLVGPGTKTWHLNGYVDIKDVEVNYKIHHVDRNKNDLVEPEKRKGKVGHQVGEVTPKTIPGYKFTGPIVKPDKLTLDDGKNDVYVYYEPDEKQTVRVTYSAEAGGYVSETVGVNTQTIHKDIQVVTGQTLTDIIAVPMPGYEFEGWYKKGPDGRRLDCGATITADIALRNLDKEKGLYKNTEYHAEFKKAQNLSYTVNYYWGNDDDRKLITQTKSESIYTYNQEVDVTPTVPDGYTPMSGSGESKTITIGADSTQNVINFYYYKNVTLTANNGEFKYDGDEHSVSGFTGKTVKEGDPVTLSFDNVNVPEVTRKDAGTDTVAFNENPVGKVDASEKYKVTAANPGTLTISPRSVTLTSASDSKVYDGTALTKPDVTVGGDGFVVGEVTDIRATGTITNVGSVQNTISYTPVEEKFNPDNYDIAEAPGTLTITPVETEVVVTITGHKDTKPYNGIEQSITGYDVDINNKLYKESDFKFSGNAEAKGKDAREASYPMGLKATDFKNDNGNFTNVTFVVEDGSLTITKRPVKLTSGSASRIYNGQPLTNSTVTDETDETYLGFVVGEVTDIRATGTITNVGSVQNTISYTPVEEKFNPDNYDIAEAPGTLTITPVETEVVVTITGHKDTKPYNGIEQSITGYDVDINNKLYKEGDFEFNGTAEVKGTDAGTYDMELKAADFENKNNNFSNVKFVVVDGKLEITPRAVTLTSASDEKVYDGKPLTKPEVTVGGDGFADGEGVTYDFTGSQTDVGSSDNEFTYTLNEGTKATNYNIELAPGKLEVTPVTEEVIVTITGRTDEMPYDGKEHSVFGYDVTVSNALYNPKEDIQFNGTDVDMTAKGTDAGTYPMELTAEHFTNKSNNFTNVTFVVTDGYVKITPRAVTLTSETAGKTYDGTALEKPVVTVGGDGFVEGQVKEIKATGSVTNAGSVANTITFTPNKETFKDGNYAITKTEGTLTIAKRSVLITSQSATKTYDGSALTRPAVTITGDGFVPGELAKAEATGSITNVGSTPNAIQYTTTGAFNAANYSIALSVGTLTVTEKPQPEPRRTFNLTVNYVYQNGKRAAASYNRGGLKNGETFDITSPVIAGYTASETVVSGTIYNRDIKVTVIYTADGVNLDDYGVPLGLGNITMNVGDCFE